MKKRLLAFSLALALCAGLAVPAFAAEEKHPAPSLSIDLPDGFTTQEKTDTYQIRRLTCETVEEPKETSVYTRDVYSYSEEASAEEFTVTPIPLGTTIRIDDPYGVNLDVSAWSDPDGDGIYHERIFSYEISTAYSCNVYSLLPLGDGPYDTSKIMDGCGTSATALHVGFWQAGIANDPLLTTSDALYKLYGPNTILKITATPYEGDAAELGCFLLTGETAPPAITMNVFNPDSTVPDQDMKFTLRNFAEDYYLGNKTVEEYTTFTRSEETETLELKDVPTLDARGVVQIHGIEAVSDDQEPWSWVRLYAWSDPDGDGVYDQQLFTFYQNTMYDPSTDTSVYTDSVSLVPLSQPGPFTFFAYMVRERGAGYARFVNLTGEGTLSSYSYTASNGSIPAPSSIILDGNYLTWLFGPDTLLMIRPAAGRHYLGNVLSQVKEGPAFYCYIPKGAAAFSAFTDVPVWFQEAVRWAAENEITNGTSYTTFSPDKNCTNAMILTFLWRAAQEPDAETPCPVKLPASLAYAEKALCWAAEQGMIDETLDPQAYCTRAGAVSYIWQAFDKQDAPASSFADVSADAAYAAAVNWAVANGVTEGVGGSRFSPDTTCTRGQIAAFLHRAYVPEARLNASSGTPAEE